MELCPVTLGSECIALYSHYFRISNISGQDRTTVHQENATPKQAALRECSHITADWLWHQGNNYPSQNLGQDVGQNVIKGSVPGLVGILNPIRIKEQLMGPFCFSTFIDTDEGLWDRSQIWSYEAIPRVHSTVQSLFWSIFHYHTKSLRLSACGKASWLAVLNVPVSSSQCTMLLGLQEATIMESSRW